MTLLTEDEAKERWCPFARYSHDNAPASNRWNQMEPPEEPYALKPVACRCIGSVCMAWRWGQKRNPDWDPLNNGLHSPAAYVVDTERGFCGLAGRPS